MRRAGQPGVRDVLIVCCDGLAGLPEAIEATWQRAWQRFTPFLAFPPMLRRIVYTTNAIESLNYQLRKITKNRGHFPSEEAAIKLLWLGICNIEDKRAAQRLTDAGKPPQQTNSPHTPHPRTHHHQLETSPRPTHHRLPRPNHPLPLPPYTEKLTGSEAHYTDQPSNSFKPRAADDALFPSPSNTQPCLAN